MPHVEQADLVVVGSGAAGLAAALRAAEHGARVAVLSGGALLAGSSPRAQGGVAAAVGADDTPALHAADTLAVGGGLNDARAVAVLVAGGSHLLERGLPFEADLGLEAGHRRRRILHAGGGATGQVLTSCLLERAQAHPCVALHAHTTVDRLIRLGERVVGVGAGSRLFLGHAVVLASGGYAALWPRSTNAPETRGSGLALAWRVGASLADLEFVQFHPTALALPGAPAFLLSEALRGEGARVVDADGREVIEPLLPRDVLARALHRHIEQRGPVYLTLRHLDADHVRARFARLVETLRTRFGLDLARDRLPVAPAAHYCMGGVRTDAWGRTDVAGLYAAGEVACSGVQGANRLASNSLLECLVFGARAAEAALDGPSDARATWSTRPLPTVEAASGVADRLAQASGSDPRPAKADARSSTTDARRSRERDPLGVSGEGDGWPAGFDPRRLDAELGVERQAASLARLVADLPAPSDPVASAALVASLAARAALLRSESRGAHHRADARMSCPAWRGRIHWRRDQAPSFEEVRPDYP